MHSVIIKEIENSDLKECLEVIQQSFGTVAA
jgi:hypothetical protein